MTSNPEDPGKCDSGCSQWADKCCANIQYKNGDQTGYDNICMNRFVVQSYLQFKLNGVTTTMNCIND